MKVLGALLLLLSVTATADDATDPRTLLLGDIALATTSRDTLARLQTWTALRGQGVQPEAEEAWIVRGVAVETSEGMIAVYEDGSVRWLEEGVDASPSREIARLAKSMMTAAESLMKTTRPMPHGDASPLGKERVRLTVMTYAGFYVIDTHAPSLTAEHPVRAVVTAATEILRLEMK